ncbi:MAG: septum formation protein Maf [Firmicutes bacterium]|nr:septum formation protein Maf [Bacillota bacterium]
MILASKSPRRIELLTKAGFDVVVMPADIEERVDPELKPHEVVMSLAKQKAYAVRESVYACSNPLSAQTDIIVAADTIVSLDEIIGKPTNVADAEKILMHLSGRKHQVYSGVAILTYNAEIIFAEKTDVFFKPYAASDIKDYLGTDEPYDKAGAYAIQGYFGRFIDHIEGDYDNVMGLPVSTLVRYLTPYM